MFIDCHAHLDHFPDHEIEQILGRANDLGVRMVISAATTLESAVRVVKISSKFPSLYAGVGIHPMDLTGPLDERTYQNLRCLANSTSRVLVISEIGLDFIKEAPDREMQYQAFREQIRLARDLGLPIVFHSREAHPETLRVLREEQAYQVGGAMHYFQGDIKTAFEAIDLGFYISLARPLLRLPDLQKVAASLPLDRVILESDAAPQPFKSKRENWTEPRHVIDVAKKLAELQQSSLKNIETITTTNLLSMVKSRFPTQSNRPDAESSI